MSHGRLEATWPAFKKTTRRIRKKVKIEVADRPARSRLTIDILRRLDRPIGAAGAKVFSNYQ
jgi:hypothetical protein